MPTYKAWNLDAIVWSIFTRQVGNEADLHLGDTQFESRSWNRQS